MKNWLGNAMKTYINAIQPSSPNAYSHANTDHMTFISETIIFLNGQNSLRIKIQLFHYQLLNADEEYSYCCKHVGKRHEGNLITEPLK